MIMLLQHTLYLVAQKITHLKKYAFTGFRERKGEEECEKEKH